MRLNILELPEAAAASWPDKPAYVSETESLTWSELLREARCVGSFLAARVPPRTPVAVLLSHSVHAVAALLGIVAAGCFNVPLDPAQPAERAKKVFERAEPGFLLYDSAAEALLRDAGDLPFPSLPYAEAARTPIDPELLTARRNGASVLDPVQVFYTSGSTGIPKGVVHTHRSLLFYSHRVCKWTEYVWSGQIWGNQAPFFYSNAIFDLFPPMTLGCTVCLIPSECFLFPNLFMEYFRSKRINTILMTPLNFLYIADSGVLTPRSLPDLQAVFMCGEAVPFRQAHMWVEAAAPGAKVSNFYGSTECPYVSVYPMQDITMAPEDIVPSGYLLEGVRLAVVDENGEEVPPGEPGEMYVSAPWISSGYFRDPKRTADVFVNDPMDLGWDCLYYRTGDIGRLDSDGILHVLGRRDSQIKHRGYRMDLGEVEAALRSLEGWQNGCCLHSEKEDKLYCFWCGPLTEKELTAGLRARIEKYMLPNVYVHLDELPRTASGKLDRTALKAHYAQP